MKPLSRATPALLAWMLLSLAGATEFHVAVTGDDDAPGTGRAPLRTIQRAAVLAQPGDTITVHAGIYRERVHPPRGGTSEDRRIVYRAAPGEQVEIRGSEPVNGWVRQQGEVWKVTVSNSLFGSFNPFADVIRGDWFDGKGRVHHTGAVYLDEDWLTEAAEISQVTADVGTNRPALWFATVGKDTTTLLAQFPGIDPNQHRTEINVRQAVFYPDQPGRNYITVRGFHLRNAATPWAPPTAEQIGLIGTHWSKGWIIESNVVSHSVCSGISLGKHGDEYDNTSANSAEGYVETIRRAHARQWNRETIGHHVVRHNVISHCEQAGIVGSLGAAFSRVSRNHIHDIHVRRLFTGAEMAGIKFHGAIDSLIEDNYIHDTCLGLWLDWMAQGTRVTRNAFINNAGQDLFLEVNHGPFLVDHNLFLSRVSLLDVSEGGAFAHNLFLGRLVSQPELSRDTPFHPPHSTALAGLTNVHGGDHRFFNNLFAGPADKVEDTTQDPGWQGGHGTWVYRFRERPSRFAGNAYYRGATPAPADTNALLVTTPFQISFWTQPDLWQVKTGIGSELRNATTFRVTTESLGKTAVARLPFVAADGADLTLSLDLIGQRHGRRPLPGPWEHPPR